MGRKASRARWRWQLAGAVLLAALLAGGWYWWTTRNFRPDEARWPDQGVEVAAADGAVDFRAVKALGGSFAYLDATRGGGRGDPAFAANLAAAREAGLLVGAVHSFDPCVPADRQTARFSVLVPRDDRLLPPAIELAALGSECPQPVSDAAVESELTILINQLETHAGKPAILKVAPAFEETYGLAARFERHLWLTRTRFEPDYAGRPWMLWTANAALPTLAGEQPLRWVVARR